MSDKANRSITRSQSILLLLGLCLLGGLAGFWSSSQSPDRLRDAAEPHAEADRTAHHMHLFQQSAATSPEHALIKASETGLSIDHPTLAAMVAKWHEREPDAPLRFLMERPELQHPVRQQLFTTLLPTIVREAPEAGLEFARNFDKESHKHMYKLVEDWAEIEPLRANEYMLSIEQNKLREQLSRTAFQTWLAIDAESAVDWLLAIDDKATQKHLLDRVNYYRVKGSLLIKLFNESHYPYEVSLRLSQLLAQGDGEGLLAILRSNPENGHLLINNRIGIRDRAHFETVKATLSEKVLDKKLNLLVASWAKSEPAEAWQWIQEQKGTHRYLHLLEFAARMLPPNEIGLDAVNAPEIPIKIKSRYLSRQLKEQADPLQWAQQHLSGALYGQTLLDSFEDLVRSRPDQIVPVVSELPEGAGKDSIIEKHTAALMLRSPVATLDLIRRQSPSQLRREQTERAVEEWIWADPDAARDYLNGADWVDNALNAKIQLTLARQLSRTDKPAAIRSLLKLPEQNGRNEALNELLEDLTIRGEARLVRKSIDRLPQGAVREQALLKVLDEFADQDPRAAYHWIQYEQGEAFQSQAFSTLSRIWVRSDSQAAGQWVRTLPPGKGRDQAVRTMVAHESAQAAHKSAFDWALTIRDDASRKSELGRALNNWAKQDREDARRAVGYASQLSESEKELLLQQIK